MDSRPDALLLKARIVIQIQPSGRQCAIVRTRVQQIWKLRIQLQLYGRLPITVRTHALQIWKLRVEDQPSERSSPLVRTRESLIWKLLAVDMRPSGHGSQTEKIFNENLRNSGRTVVHPDGSGLPSGVRPYILQQSPI